jgi:hypothetical protein
MSYVADYVVNVNSKRKVWLSQGCNLHSKIRLFTEFSGSVFDAEN